MKSHLTHLPTWLLLLIFVLFTGAVATFDVAPAGPHDITVGWSHLNGTILEAFGTHPLWDTISDLPLLVALLIACGWAIRGVTQWHRRRRLSSVDGEVLLLGGIYLLTAMVNIIFETLFINPRPLPIDGLLEPGYPSTHVLLVAVILGTHCLLTDRPLTLRHRRIQHTLALLLLAITIVGRLLSGMHWTTDLLGALLLSAVLLGLTRDLLKKCSHHPPQQKKRS